MSINPGTHQAHAVAVDFGTAKTGTEQVAITFETDEGSRITWYGYFTDKAAEYAIKTLRVCGWQGDDLSAITVADINDPVELVVEEEDDRSGSGDVKAKVRWVNRPGGAALKQPLPPDKRKAFGARWKAACAAEPVQPRAARPAVGQRQAAAGPLEDPGYDREGLGTYDEEPPFEF